MYLHIGIINLLTAVSNPHDARRCNLCLQWNLLNSVKMVHLSVRWGVPHTATGPRPVSQASAMNEVWRWLTWCKAGLSLSLSLPMCLWCWGTCWVCKAKCSRIAVRVVRKETKLTLSLAYIGSSTCLQTPWVSSIHAHIIAASSVKRTSFL